MNIVDDHSTNSKNNLKTLRLYVPEGKGPKLRDRIIYAFLIYQAAIEKTPTVRQIADWTGLHLSYVERGLSRLREARLVVDGRAVEPPPGIFKKRKTTAEEAADWTHRFQYVTTYLPGDQISHEHAAVWSLIDGQPERFYSDKGLGRYCSIHHDKASRIVKELRHNGILDIFQLGLGKGFKVLSVKEPKDAAHLLAKNETARTSRRSFEATLEEMDYAPDSLRQWVYRKCRIDGQPVKLAGENAELAAVKGVNWNRFDDIFRQAKHENDRDEYGHCGLLLKWKLEQLPNPASLLRQIEMKPALISAAPTRPTENTNELKELAGRLAKKYNRPALAIMNTAREAIEYHGCELSRIQVLRGVLDCPTVTAGTLDDTIREVAKAKAGIAA